MIRCHVLFAALTTFAWMIAPALAADGDAIAGKAVFQRTCQNRHAVEIGGQQDRAKSLESSLWNVVGRQPASVPDYACSEGMKTNKTPWGPSSLDAYLADRRGDVHGVRMFFKGLADTKDHADVIAYLQTLK